MFVAMTNEHVRDILASVTRENQAAWARANNMSPSYVSDVLRGRREPGKPILAALGLRCETSYYWIAKGVA